MIRSLALALALLIGAAMAPALAEVWLDDAEIERALRGRTLEGVYASGRRFSEHYLVDGRLEYSEDGLSMTGRWSVTAGRLCTLYDTDPTGGCFRISPTGRNCFEFYFVSRTEEAAPRPSNVKPDWTARGAVNGKVEACPEISSV